MPDRRGRTCRWSWRREAGRCRGSRPIRRSRACSSDCRTGRRPRRDRPPRRNHCGSHVDDARALGHSAEHLFGLRAARGHVLDVSRRVLGADGCALGEFEGARVVDRVDAQRAPADLRSERIDERLAHIADAGTLARAAGERHFHAGARIGVCGRDARRRDQQRRHDRDRSAKDADDAREGCTHGSMLTQRAGGCRHHVVGTVPRQSVSGRSLYVAIPGAAATTAGIALMGGIAVMMCPSAMKSSSVSA